MSFSNLLRRSLRRLTSYPRTSHSLSLRTRNTIASTTAAFISYRSVASISPSLNVTTNHLLDKKESTNTMKMNQVQKSQSRRSSSQSTSRINENHHSVIILGSGPAGLTAALYASRANLSPVVLEGNEAGGQLTTTTEVENYPGFPKGIQGYDLIMDMKAQTERFGTVFIQEHVESVDLSQRPFTLKTGKSTYYADTLIIASGASAKYLGLKNEQRLVGHGVSACATCDGFFFKGQEIAVIGGGDTAMEEANFLTKFASKVYIIHRRDEFRASKIMQDRTFGNEKIEVIWNTVCTDVLGEDKVEGLKLKNVVEGTDYVLNVTGLFLGIGHAPNTQCFKDSGLKLDEHGYIEVEPGTVSTSIEGVFACGDVQDTRYKQAITAAGTGCMAAMDAEKFLEAQEHASVSKL